MVQEAQLGVFARLPVPGKVKTRLAAAVGPDQATSAYKAFAENCFREASRCCCCCATQHERLLLLLLTMLMLMMMTMTMMMMMMMMRRRRRRMTTRR